MNANPYARTTFHGKPLDVATIEALKIAEQRLGYELTITQGIGGSVSASAGTHMGRDGEGGRAVDLSSWDKARKLRVLKDLGFAVWFRPTISGLWHEHIHGVLILDRFDNARGVAPAAFRQIGSYTRGRDGLKGDRSDSSYRPSPLVAFHFPPKEPAVPPFSNNVTEARDLLVEAAHALGKAAVRLEAAPKTRAVVRAQALACRAAMRTVNGILHVLPKK